MNTEKPVTKVVTRKKLGSLRGSMVMDSLLQEGERPQILIVEDEAQLRASLVSILAPQYPECDLVAVGSATEALGIALQHEVHCLITDLKLPDIDGLELIRKIKERSPKAALLLITAFGKEQVLRRAGVLGCHAYLEKPFQVDRLLVQVDALLGRTTDLRCAFPDLTIGDVLQMFVGHPRSALLEIISEHQAAYIAVREGRLVDAQFAGKRGPEAFVELLELRQAQISSNALSQDFEETLDISVEVLSAILKSHSGPERLLLLREHARPSDAPLIQQAPAFEEEKLPQAVIVGVGALSPRPENLRGPTPVHSTSERSHVAEEFDENQDCQPETDPADAPWKEELVLRPEPKFSAEHPALQTRRDIRERKIKELVAKGIAEFRAYRLDSAKRAWVSALRLDPECSAARKNLDILASLTKGELSQ